MGIAQLLPGLEVLIRHEPVVDAHDRYAMWPFCQMATLFAKTASFITEGTPRAVWDVSLVMLLLDRLRR